MQALLAVAGKGTRMRKTHAEPKHLLPIANKPVIEHFVDKLPGEVDELVLIVGGPHKETIQDFFGSKFKGRSPKIWFLDFTTWFGA